MTDRNLQTVRNAIVMTLLDGDISEEEQNYLGELRDGLGLKQSDIETLMEEIRENPNRMSIPRGPEGREALSVMIRAAQADGTICENERRVLEKVGRFLELGESEIAAMINDAEITPELQRQLDRQIDALYSEFGQWDDSQRAAHLDAMAAAGRAAVVPLIRILESYRTPEQTDDPLLHKRMVVEQLGRLGDVRAVYYLAQQVSLDTDDEISSPALRHVCAEAIAAITGEMFRDEQEGPFLDNARRWWRDKGQKAYNRLAY
jgi:tellurite resistance protein